MSVNCDPKALAKASACYCYGDKKVEDAIITYLLCQIANSIGGGGKCGWSWGPNQTVYDYIDINSDPNVQTISFPTLVTSGPFSGAIIFHDCTSLISAEFPSLSTMVGPLTFNGCSSLSTLNLSNLSSVGGEFNGAGCSSLTAIDIPLLTAIGGNVLMHACTNLANFNAPMWVPTDGTTIFFSGDSLVSSSIEQILRRCVLAGVTTCTIDLSGGTNAGLASLSAQGQLDAAALGAQLTINP